MKLIPIIISVFLSLATINSFGSQLSVDLTNPDAMFLELNSAVGETKFSTGKTEEDFLINRKSFLKLNKSINRLDKFSLYFGKRLRKEIGRDEVLNGHQISILGHLINIYHHVAIKFNELNSYAKPSEINEFLDPRDSITFGKDLLWLSSYLKLYSSFYQNYQTYYHDSKLRRLLKNIVKTKANVNGKEKELFIMMSHILENSHRKVIREYLRVFIQYKKDMNSRNKGHELDQEIKEMIASIPESFAYDIVLSKNKFEIKNHVFVDTLVSFFGSITNAISGMFGNLVGKIRWRHGYLFNDEQIQISLEKSLKPLDIILEKTPFALTDAFIPGHFGHAAVYLGSKEQLIEAGLWNSEVIAPYQKEIEAGKRIIEAVRPGVRLTSLKDFLEIDDILILRKPDIIKNKELSLKVYSRAFDQLGKEYDFNFDVETTDKIVCSELIFLAFGEITWPTEYIFGRPTISPDNVAELMYYEKSPVNFVLNYWSKKKGQLTKVKSSSLAKKIGYVFNKKRSRNGKESFDKKIRSCKTIVKRNIRVGSRRRRRIELRVCRTKLKQFIYNNSTSYRDTQYVSE
ncbi:hypothetical protein A9Q84_02350 [Halobacteriovorax marinus]|uniref:Uncharacterized protein n=1 Tax=Halobacteriovorax marinus TaxID=97084 RepID=A0A1Y5FCZ0_9BACT|nr:hypothetical protein A9Q84_02350 [Halobacteriovorax marinus]